MSSSSLSFPKLKPKTLDIASNVVMAAGVVALFVLSAKVVGIAIVILGALGKAYAYYRTETEQPKTPGSGVVPKSPFLPQPPSRAASAGSAPAAATPAGAAATPTARTLSPFPRELNTPTASAMSAAAVAAPSAAAPALIVPKQPILTSPPVSDVSLFEKPGSSGSTPAASSSSSASITSPAAAAAVAASAPTGIAALKKPSSMNWNPANRKLSPEEAHAHMVKNATKAIREAREEMEELLPRDLRTLEIRLKTLKNYPPIYRLAGDDAEIQDIENVKLPALREKLLQKQAQAIAAYATESEAPPPSFEQALKGEVDPEPLEFSISHAEDIGPRSKMEDYHFAEKVAGGLLVGVADGHGGQSNAVPKQICTELHQKFESYLAKHQGNVHQAFEHLIFDIDEAHKHEWREPGSTLVVSFIKGRDVYTATLADAEANIYRRIDGKLKSIPLSVKRNWGSKKEAIRYAIAAKEPSHAETLPKRINKKGIYYFKRRENSHHTDQINVSRSIGDKSMGEVISVKPKITIQSVQPGDILFWVSDGPKDAVNNYENEFMEQIEKCLEDPNADLAKHIVKFAVSTKTNDNMTAVAIKVSAGKPAAPAGPAPGPAAPAAAVSAKK